MNSWNDWNKCLDQASAGSVGDPNNSDELKQDCALTLAAWCERKSERSK
jgi:hypothetical protein